MLSHTPVRGKIRIFRAREWANPAQILDLLPSICDNTGCGLLSNLHLGARDPESGQFVMLGKTFKGMTDEMLAWQTQKLLSLATERGDWVVKVRPELVVEIAFNNIQQSPQYPAGMALRFARVKQYRTDKTPEEADTIQTVRALFESHH